MIPSSRPKLSDLYTLSQSKLLENHTLHSGTYLYSPYMAVTPPSPRVQTEESLSATVKIVAADNNYPPLMQPAVQQRMTLIS